MRTHRSLGIALASVLIFAAGPNFAQDRPEAGTGAIFADGLSDLQFTFTDLRGDFLRATFKGSPSDFVRLAPDGRYFLRVQDVDARVQVTLANGRFLTGSAIFRQSVIVFCEIFDPAGESFRCFFPGPGSASLHARGLVTDLQNRTYDLQAHLTGVFRHEGQFGGPFFRNILNDISATPIRRRVHKQPIVTPTHLGSIPVGGVIAIEAATARSFAVGDSGAASLSGLALSDDGRLFGSLGFQGGGSVLEIDPAMATILRTLPTGFSSVPGIDFGPAGTPFAGVLYGSANPSGGSNDYRLVTIDTDTGASIEIGPIGVPFVDSIVFADDGSLFGAAFVDGASVLIRIDPLTGQGTVIGPIGFLAISGLEVDGSDLIGSLGGADGLAGSLVRIDPTTGVGTVIGFTGFVPVSGLARIPEMSDLEGL